MVLLRELCGQPKMGQRHPLCHTSLLVSAASEMVPGNEETRPTDQQRHAFGVDPVLKSELVAQTTRLKAPPP